MTPEEPATSAQPATVETRALAGPGAPGRTADEISADVERTRGELSQSVDLLRNRVGELTDWRRQIREHQDQIVAGAAVVGFAVGALLVARRLRRR